jgi:hypothetical protein
VLANLSGSPVFPSLSVEMLNSQPVESKNH